MTRRRRLQFAALRRRAGRDETSSLSLPNLPNAELPQPPPMPGHAPNLDSKIDQKSA